MAISKNPLLRTISGRIGDIVIRQCNGKTVLCKASVYRKKATTKQELKSQQRFAVCSKVASKALQNKATRDYYEKLAKAAGAGRSAYNMAFTDAFKAYEQGTLFTNC